MLSALLQSNYLEAQATTRDPDAPAQFIAGWHYGIAHEKERDDLSCFVADDDLTNTLYDAMEAYIAGNHAEGDAKMTATVPLYKEALSGCGRLATLIGKWAQRIDEMKERQDWQQILKEIYNANKDLIDRDTDLELKEWEQKDFFNSGMFAGQRGKVFLDNLPQEPKVPADFYAGWF